MCCARSWSAISRRREIVEACPRRHVFTTRAGLAYANDSTRADHFGCHPALLARDPLRAMRPAGDCLSDCEPERLKTAFTMIRRPSVMPRHVLERQRAEDERQRVDDVKAERDRWASQAERLACPRPKRRAPAAGGRERGAPDGPA